MNDPRDVIFDDLNPSLCRIVNTDSPVVLLCGGSVKIKERPDDPDPPIQSLRHAITLKCPDFEIFRPEEITTWQEDAIFKNLVDFEAELATICSLIVIILESPGSIAELGAFSQLNELRAKLVVIRSSYFSQGNNSISFINFGILRYLIESNQQSVKTFPWNINNPETIDEDTIEDVIAGIGNSLASIGDTQVLNAKHESHATTLICELIRIFIALKQGEIINYAKKFGFNLTKEQVQRKLFLLEKFHLIRAVYYDGAKFYLRTKHQYNKLRLGAAKGKRLEDVNIILDCQAYYKETRDRHRLGAIKHFHEEVRQ